MHLVASEKSYLFCEMRNVELSRVEIKVQLLSSLGLHLILWARIKFTSVLDVWKKMSLSLFKSTYLSVGKNF